VNVDGLLALARAVRSAKSLPDAARAALSLARPLAEDLRALFELDQRIPNDALLLRVLALPLELSSAGETELALSVARAFLFAARAELSGDIAVILARAGRRAEALAQLDANLSAATNPYVAEAKAGDVYRALGELDAAEAYYRRALAIAPNESDRSEAVLRITSFLLDSGRDADADAFVKAQSKAPSRR
jgi:tetratricopeptide (TPR) repeat protein